MPEFRLPRWLRSLPGRLAGALALVAVVLGLMGMPAVAQFLPDLEAIDHRITSQAFIPVFNQGNLEIAPVFLDGRMVGAVPGYIRIGSDPNDPRDQMRFNASERAHVIHSRLQKHLTNLTNYSTRRLEPNRITDVVAQRRELDRLLNISVEAVRGGARVMLAFPRDDPPELLYTVTPADVARVRTESSDPIAIARRIATGARRVLLRAWEERQPPFLLASLRRSLVALMVLSVISGGGHLLQKQLRRRHQALSARLETGLGTPTSKTSNDGEAVGESGRVRLLNRRISLRQQLSLLSFYRSSLYWGQWLLWVSGLGFLAGLFPATRPFRNWLIGVSVRGYWGSANVVDTGWPPLDWLLSFGAQASVGLPLLILLLILLTQISIRGGHLLTDFYVQHWTQAQADERLKLRAPTLARALKAWVRVGIYLLLGLVVFYHLHELGAVTQAAAIVLGFLSFALSLASQNLLKDLIGGFLILYEDQYAVGDVVIIGDQGGLVEQVGLRVTKLRNLDGELITIPNGAITTVRNLSSNWSRVNYAIEVGIAEDPDRVMAIMNEVARELFADPEWRTLILEVPEILGIDEITHHGILIRMLIRVRPLQQWAVAREYRRRLKHALDAAGISVGVPRLELEKLPSGSVDGPSLS